MVAALLRPPLEQTSQHAVLSWFRRAVCPMTLRSYQARRIPSGVFVFFDPARTLGRHEETLVCQSPTASW